MDNEDIVYRNYGGSAVLLKTSELAVRVLIHLALRDKINPISPRKLAQRTGSSPTYTAKVCSLLVKAGVLRAFRGTAGGVLPARPPADITLLDIVEACQGKILGNYCEGSIQPEKVCAFHKAMLDLHQSIVGSLGKWTLADLAAKPSPDARAADAVHCLMGEISDWTIYDGKRPPKAKRALAHSRS